MLFKDKRVVFKQVKATKTGRVGKNMEIKKGYFEQQQALRNADIAREHEINQQSPFHYSPTSKTCPVIHGYPFVGVLPQLLFNPLRLFQRAVKEHLGEIVALKLGSIQAHLVTYPDHVQYILNDNWQNFGKGEAMWKPVRQVAGNNLLTSQGESWIRSRRLMQPMFTANQANALTELLVKIIASELANFEKTADGGAIDMENEMARLTQRVILRLLFSSSIDGSKVETLGEALKVILREISRRAFLSFLPKQFPVPGERTFRNAIQTTNDIIFTIIRARRQSDLNHGDLLERLLQARDEESKIGMNDQQLLNESITLFIAGYETTSTTLTWIWYLLDKYPEVEHKLRAEIDGVIGKRHPASADVAKLQYTKMVIQEAMRFYPPGWFFSRVVQTDDIIDGYALKAGTTVVLCPYLTHHLPKFWNQPEVFDPERFAPEYSGQRHSYSYFPFGGGPRYCIGKHLALLEMQLIIAMMLQKYRLRCVPGHPVESLARITLRPRYGLRMIVEPI
ncbi:cytochrome P450 [Scytonema sp. UIC 10036]|uniref:cytochrome P450 n=1 Tax=Scytonema sp. UIC 10036 TaxID=2304196 RepID=UPI0012DAD4B8|nr:cytochrome P450 [Scytonema sp. UIC 10036]MUG94294.1 cytochrome P450 [Scytonema sp. UIC 10036]